MNCYFKIKLSLKNILLLAIAPICPIGRLISYNLYFMKFYLTLDPCYRVLSGTLHILYINKCKNSFLN